MKYFIILPFIYTSGPCLTLIISKGGTGDGVIPQFRDLIGPKDVNKAKEEAPTRYVDGRYCVPKTQGVWFITGDVLFISVSWFIVSEHFMEPVL